MVYWCLFFDLILDINVLLLLKTMRFLNIFLFCIGTYNCYIEFVHTICLKNVWSLVNCKYKYYRWITIRKI